MKRFILFFFLLGILASGPGLYAQHPWASCAVQPGEFTIAVLPDTQFYTAALNGGAPSMFTAQTNWIKNNQAACNIVYVVHVGDIVEYGDIPANESAWMNAKASMKVLEDAGIPYGITVGNHDTTPRDGGPNPPNGTSTADMFNKYFSTTRIKNLTNSTWKGSYVSGKNNSHYDFFNAGGVYYTVIYLEYDDNGSCRSNGTKETNDPGLLTWAKSIVDANPQRSYIIVSHYIATNDKPANFGANQGTKIFNAFKGYTNVQFMFSGHIAGQGKRQDVTGSGSASASMISSLMADYQGETNGGNGYMRLYTFNNSKNMLTARTYSPVLDYWRRSEHDAFQIQQKWTSRMDVFYRNSDNSLGHITWNGSVWTVQNNVSGSTLISDPVAVSPGGGLIYIFYQGVNGHLMQKVWDNTSWGPELDLGVTIYGAPAVAARGQYLVDVFYKGAGGTLEQTEWDGLNWTAQPSLGGTLASDPSAVSWDSEKMDVIYRGTDGTVKHRAYSPDAGWSGIYGTGDNSIIVGTPAIASMVSGRIDIFAEKSDNTPYHMYYVEGTGWDTFHPIPGAMGGTGNAVASGQGRIDYIFRGTGTQLWTVYWDGSQWQQQAVGGTPAGAPAVASWSHIDSRPSVPTDSACTGPTN